LIHCQSSLSQTLSNQYSAQVPLSHDCDPCPLTRNLGGGRVLAQAISQLDKPTLLQTALDPNLAGYW
jgi:hypothetical protein